ncbi:hypothetical protein SKAU_G00036580 [Synaphobranchus kaupii]|uniref:Uncharacterized protein n=1 Tax=Synaphobranchus kaupii TaxID=118154 RepID=A0A9Q1GEW5_SYNKA|nr:hypothetical protein SKAU_G00036580 [Synaphobranchus kaupii]
MRYHSERDYTPGLPYILRPTCAGSATHAIRPRAEGFTCMARVWSANEPATPAPCRALPCPVARDRGQVSLYNGFSVLDEAIGAFQKSA